MHVFNNYSCFECYARPTEYYCCCDQLFLCSNCKSLHSDSTKHFLIHNRVTLIAPPSDICNSFITYIEFLKAELISRCDSDCKQINPAQLYDSLPEGYRLSVKEELLNRVFPSNSPDKLLVQLSKDKESLFFEVDLETSSLSPKPITNKINIVYPFMFTIEKCIYLVGGKIGLQLNLNIYEGNPETQKISKLGEMPILVSFGCTRYGKMLFIIGGKLTENNTRVRSKEVMVFDLQSQEMIRKYAELNRERQMALAVVHMDHLYVFSQNTLSAEVMNLKDQSKTFNEFGFSVELDSNCAAVSVKDKIYLLKNDCLIEVNRNLEAQLIIQFDSHKKYFLYIEPQCVNNILYFISPDTMARFPLSSIESYEFLPLTHNPTRL
jgi:hypothetical protein